MTRRNIAGIRFTSGYPDNKSYQNLFPLPVHGNYYQRVSLLHHRGRMWNCVCDSKISHLHRWFWAINQPFIFFLFFYIFLRQFSSSVARLCKLWVQRGGDLTGALLLTEFQVAVPTWMDLGVWSGATVV